MGLPKLSKDIFIKDLIFDTPFLQKHPEIAEMAYPIYLKLHMERHPTINKLSYNELYSYYSETLENELLDLGDKAQPSLAEEEGHSSDAKEAYVKYIAIKGLRTSVLARLLSFS